MLSPWVGWGSRARAAGGRGGDRSGATGTADDAGGRERGRAPVRKTLSARESGGPDGRQGGTAFAAISVGASHQRGLHPITITRPSSRARGAPSHPAPY